MFRLMAGGLLGWLESTCQPGLVTAFLLLLVVAVVVVVNVCESVSLRIRCADVGSPGEVG